MGIEFKSTEELYNRVRPALSSKVKEFRRINIKYIMEEDIWNYLIETKWKKANGLELHNIVDDILNTSNDDIIEYVNNEMRKVKRTLNMEDININ